MEAAERTRAALAAAVLADPCSSALSADGSMAETEAWEAVGRIVGEPLHLGRRVRVFSAAQKKALGARHGGCA